MSDFEKIHTKSTARYVHVIMGRSTDLAQSLHPLLKYLLNGT